MLDREKIVVVLKRRFPGSAAEQIAAAANAIVGMDDEWVEVARPKDGWPRCDDGCYLADAAEVRVFRRAHGE